MPLPEEWPRIQIYNSGPYLEITGRVLAGKVIHFTPQQQVLFAGSPVFPRRIDCTLDVDGNIPADFELPSTTAPDLDVTGWSYLVQEDWANGRSFYMEVPHDGGSIDLPQVAPVVTPQELVSIEESAVVQRALTAAAAAEQSAQTASTAAGSIGTAVEDTQVAAAAAALSAETASTAAGSIGTAVEDAQTAATAAGTSATSAGEAKTASETARDAALAAKGAAETAKTAAETAKTAAETAATSAGNSATQAAALIAGTALLRHGTGAPSDALGNDGDYYLDDAAPQTLYGPKAGGAWPAGISLQGPAGSNAVWTQITQAAYDVLDPPDGNTLYVIVG